jgi:DNA repair protein RadC
MGGAYGEDLREGHHARLRRRFRDEGLGGFEAHQSLKLPLFKGLAPLPLRLHGSLSGVLDADVVDLATAEGIGGCTATLLSLVPVVAGLYLHDRCRRLDSLKTTRHVVEFIIPLMVGRSEEVFYVPQLRRTSTRRKCEVH